MGRTGRAPATARVWSTRCLLGPNLLRPSVQCLRLALLGVKCARRAGTAAWYVGAHPRPCVRLGADRQGAEIVSQSDCLSRCIVAPLAARRAMIRLTPGLRLSRPATFRKRR